jgi:hypothetical protein
MLDIPIELDLQIQEVQANLISSYEKYNELSTQFGDMLYILEFTPENSDKVNNFVSGLESLQEGFYSLLEATKLIAEMRGIVLSKK